jgi:flavin-dependent dehydrogenase
VTPVPGGRVNAGVVIRGGAFQRGVREHGRPEGLHRSIVEQMPAPWERWRDAPATDTVVTSFPLGHRVTRAAGNGFLLVGDAAGYVDPLSGEGIHRAFVSARMAASAIGASLAGESRALETYSERLRERFARKDLVSWLLQMATSRPAMTDYVVERLARRGELRRTFLLVMADLAPVERALRPRFLAALFAP